MICDECKEHLIEKLKHWIENNALCLTSYDYFCWDDGFIMFKKNDIKAKGDWSQKRWDKQLAEFREEYVNYEELIRFIDGI